MTIPTYRIRDWDSIFENASSRKLKRLDWVAIPIQFDVEQYVILIDHPNGPSHYAAWIAIVLASGRQPKELRGVIPQGPGGICRSLGRISRLPADLFNEVIPRLVGLGMIEQIQQDTTSLGESANAVGDSADAVAESPKHREGQDREGEGRTHTIVRVPRRAVNDIGAGAIPGAFADFWGKYPRKVHQDEAARAWISVGADDVATAVMECLGRYLKSGEVARGAVKNASGWLFECARDQWACEWPAQNGGRVVSELPPGTMVWDPVQRKEVPI